MSTSPKSPKHYYASRPSSRSASRNGNSGSQSPATPAQVRLQAVARLKRAASLPRHADGRRPLQQHARATDEDISSANDSPIQVSTPASQHDEREGEMLSPSPTQTGFDRQNVYPLSSTLQRSASAASNHSAAQGHEASPTDQINPDWHAIQLAQSYIPSLAPITTNGFQQPVPIGRSTPSPLPTLGELRSLSRSNSQAARARAMSKLTGGKENLISDDDVVLQLPLTRPGLQRAGTVGAHRLLGMPMLQLESEHQRMEYERSTAFDQPRPKLQRSFTVSSSNMGEERRSAVGRKMLEQLAKRREARQKEEEEVRQLWEQRRANVETAPKNQNIDGSPQGRPTIIFDKSTDQSKPGLNQPQARTADLLVAPERSASRGTMQSAQFEYEGHLRRSFSSRTAIGAVGTDPEHVPIINEVDSKRKEETEANLNQLVNATTPTLPQGELAQATDLYKLVGDSESPLKLPLPPFATPSRHTPHSSTSTQDTIQGHQFMESSTPEGSSRSGLNSIMFVMGAKSHDGQLGRTTTETQWPSEVSEGSDWGTPGTGAQKPLLASSSNLSLHVSGPFSNSCGSNNSSASHHTDSNMSGEEADIKGKLEKDPKANSPSDSGSESMTAKVKRTVNSVIRSKGQSRSPRTSAGSPISPRGGSKVSNTPFQTSGTRSWSKNDNAVKYQPSVSSLSPSLTDLSTAASTNNLLIQHQLASDPTQVSFLPRATLNDPRIHMSKLSPFPGIENLESQHEVAKLGQQSSDSVVPSQHHSASTSLVGSDSVYANSLSTRGTDESRRMSDDSISKKNWLTKAFTSPRASMSKKFSQGEMKARENTLGQGAIPIGTETDPFASPPLGAIPTTFSSLTRPTSPTISVVSEASEEDARLTRYTTKRDQLNTEIISKNIGDLSDVNGQQEQLSGKSRQILRRMSEVLAMGPDDLERPEILDDPPRKFLLSAQVLQIVNANTVKDRFLLLFNDILVITKPQITHGVHTTFDMKLAVKNVVSLDRLSLSVQATEPTADTTRHPVVENFIRKFAANPVEACNYALEKSKPKADVVSLANLIFKTPELDKVQIGNLLVNHQPLKKAFVDCFRFASIRIDDALRIFLLSLRLPTNPMSCDNLLRGFVDAYCEANKDIITYNENLAYELVLAILQFNDALYSTFGFALPNHAITKDTFISAFRSKDPVGLVPDELLWDVYLSIRSMRLSQALAPTEAHLEREVLVNPAHIPSKLTYNTWSETIKIKIPISDPMFKIVLLGEGLEFDPPVLDFSRRSEESFRVKGKSLGNKSILFERIGSNAALYSSLGNTRHITIERAFMRHTFQISFTNQNGLKRRYCIGVNTAETCHRWRTLLEKQIQETSELKMKVRSHEKSSTIRQTAEAVSLQVLRDALMSPEEKMDISHCSSDKSSQSVASGGFRPNTATDQSRSRAGSVSLAYAQYALKEEYDLGPLQPTRGNDTIDTTSSLVGTRTGKELVLLCRQNSLMPGLLELLHAGTGRSSAESTDDDGIGEGRNMERFARSKGIRV
ncbi:hypothetical protein L204_103451 [Cryptococcus depauperatus]